MQSKTLAAFLFVCLIPVSAIAQPGYTLTDLGPLSPTGINSWAQVVGNYNGHAFMWTRIRGLKDLGLLPGGSFSMAASINDAGVVAGTANGNGIEVGYTSEPTECSDLIQPFLWTQSGGMRGLGAQYYSGEFWQPCEMPTFATGANILGQVVGYTGAARTYQYGFLWEDSNWTALGPFGDPPDSGNAINDRGQFVGQVGGEECTGCSPGHAALWNNGSMTDLGTLVGSDPYYEYGSSANSINELGQIVGWSGNGGPGTYSGVDLIYTGAFHAVSWITDGSIHDLGTLPGDVISSAAGINLFGEIVGTSGNTATYSLYNGEYGDLVSPCCSVGVSGRAFVWSERSGMQDLNTFIRGHSGWVLNSATGVNVWGQIVGQGTLNGQPHGFLLTPRNPFQRF